MKQHQQYHHRHHHQIMIPIVSCINRQQSCNASTTSSRRNRDYCIPFLILRVWYTSVMIVLILGTVTNCSVILAATTTDTILEKDTTTTATTTATNVPDRMSIGDDTISYGSSDSTDKSYSPISQPSVSWKGTQDTSTSSSSSSSSSSFKSTLHHHRQNHHQHQQIPSHIFTFAGSERPITRTLLQSVKPQQKDYLSVIRQSIQSFIHLEDLTLLAFFSYMTVPIGQWMYEWIPSILPQQYGNTNNSNNNKETKRNDNEFHTSIYYEIVDHIQQLARIALTIYCFDIIKLIIVGLGYTIPGTILPNNSDGGTTTAILPHAFGHILYTIWISNRVGYWMRYVLRRFVNQHPETFGRITLFQKWMNMILHVITILMVLHILKVESGVAINRSFLAVGSVGTLAFGLASQGIATQVINGLLLASSDRIYEGDDVMLGSNGFAGNIVKLGWLETVIRGSDEIMISIPNADLLKERLSNLSRVRHSQVKQVLRLRYDDVDKIPTLIDQIKQEIQRTCPSVIVDGTRPFRVHWTAINTDHCEITVDTRHHIKPVGDAYLDNKQNVLTAIYTALKRNNCKLVESPVAFKVQAP